MEYVDVDGDGSTFSSSSADFTVPSGGVVLFAGLYWGGRSTDANRYSVQLATPTSGGYVGLTATQQDVDVADERYSGFIDVTPLVQAGGTGTYAVANVQGQPGQTNRYAGWSLIVVVRDPAAPIRSMAVFDGYAEVTTTTPSVNIPVTGLLTPPTGPVNTRMGAVAYEGDLNLTGDELQLNGVTVGDAENPTTNFFNSSISRLGVPLSTKNPHYLNQLSFDADIVDVTPFGAIGNGATSATITLTTSGDFYWPAAVTFVTDLFEPVIQPGFLKTVTDINGGVVQPGDTLRYAIGLVNSGNDAALNMALADTLPANTSYVPGSVEILAGANTGTTVPKVKVAPVMSAKMSKFIPPVMSNPPVAKRMSRSRNSADPERSTVER